MGVERKSIGTKISAENEVWLQVVKDRLLPLEVTESSLINSIVTDARNRFPDGNVRLVSAPQQELPRTAACAGSTASTDPFQLFLRVAYLLANQAIPVAPPGPCKAATTGKARRSA